MRRSRTKSGKYFVVSTELQAEIERGNLKIVNFAALSVPLQGTLFEFGDFEFVGVRNDVHIENIVIQIGSNVAQRIHNEHIQEAGQVRTTAVQLEEVGVESPLDKKAADVEIVHDEAHAFTVETTVVFDRPDFAVGGDIHLRYLRLVPMTSQTRRLVLDQTTAPQLDLNEVPKIIADDQWVPVDKPRRRSIPKSFYGHPTAARGSTILSQGFTRDGKRSLTFYKLPLGKTFEVAGQKYRFEESAVMAAYLAIYREEAKPNDGVRRLVLLARPRTEDTLDD